MIFILGVGRSGTSLLQSILNSHSKISFLPETQFLRKYVFNKNLKICDNNYNDIINKLNNDKRFKRLNINPKDIVHIDNTMYEVYQNVIRQYLIDKNKIFIGDKDPKLIEHIGSLYKYFSSAKIIHIIRDPRDVVLSRIKAKWSQRFPYYLHAIIYYLQINLGLRELKKTFNENYYEVFYEDLLQNPKQELIKIMTFLELDYEHKMLDFLNSSKELVSKDELDWKAETFKPINKHNFNKWKKELTQFQNLVIESICYFPMIKKKYKNNIRFFSLNILLAILFQPILLVAKVIYKIKLKND
jgi:hypothetical protein